MTSLRFAVLRRGLALALLIGSPGLLCAAVFTVNSAADTDDGVCNASNCTLREAMNAANAALGTDTIRFSIGSGVRTILPGSALPTITDPVIIDGTTQPGYTGFPIIEIDGENAGTGSSGLHITAGGSLVTGLVINRFVPAFPSGGGHGILLEFGGGNEIRGNYIGTNVAGTAALSNGGDGVQISQSAGNLVGRTDTSFRINVMSGNAYGVHILGLGANMNVVAGDRIGTNAAGTATLGNGIAGVAVNAGTDNMVGSAIANDTLVSGNDGDGILISGSASGTIVQHCNIGTDALGHAALGNGSQGVEVADSPNNTVGPGNLISGNLASGVLLINGSAGNIVAGNLVGTDAAGGAAVGNALNGVIASDADANTIGPSNTVSGNGTNGVRIRSGASGNTVIGNFIGVNALGTAAIPNLAEGVQLNDGATNNTVGAAGSGGNVISGNTNNGVLIADATTTGNTITGNRIGSDPAGIAAIGNGASGVDIQGGAGGNTIGGASAGSGNFIAFNLGRGVFVEAGGANAILGNGIAANGSLGIDLAPAGLTPNDTGDGDTGANQLQNFPLLTAIQLGVSSTTLQGSLNSAAGAAFRIELFASAACDPSGNGEGQIFLGETDPTTDGGGNAAFLVSLPSSAPGPWITATATDPSGNTSEFSACLPVPPPAVLSIGPTSGPAAGGTPVTVTGFDFQTPALLRIGGAAASLVDVVSGIEITGASPGLSPGTLNDVQVTDPSGLSGVLGHGWLADFIDVPGSSPFHGAVESIFRAGITAGCQTGFFCADAPVTRAQMAIFLLKAEHGSGYVPPAPTGTVFDDVGVDTFAAAWIERLAAEGITAGCHGQSYCPDNPVSRAEMAVLLLKTRLGTGYVPPAATGLVFDDVAIDAFAAKWIEDLQTRGIATGCSLDPPLFCPESSNTRAQMAVFLKRTFGIP